MKKAVFHVPNTTGRIFICIEENDELLDNSSDHFNVGSQYLEAIIDDFQANYASQTSDDKELLIVDNFGMPLYVNSSSFLLLEKEVNTIALEKIWLN